MAWQKAASVAELHQRPVLFNSRPKQIAIFQVNGEVFAVDNRCPHEGYPLVEGTVDESCVLTCNWHNWKFRLADGRCILGGDNVRTWPVRVEDGEVWVNTDDPPAEEIEVAVLQGLRTAFDERDYGRICREIARLHFHGLDPLTAVRRAVQWSHDRLEFGFTHAWAAAADWLALYHRLVSSNAPHDAVVFTAPPRSGGPAGDAPARDALAWDKPLVCLAETVDHMAFDALRHRAYPYADPTEPFHSASFLDAVEREDRAAAEAMLRRGLADGLHWPDMEEAFAEAALAHYNDFGHSLIYVYKAGQLIEQLGEGVEPLILPALARSICYATREDLIPEFREYGPALESLAEPRGAQASLPAPVMDPERPAAPFPASLREAFAWLYEQMPRCSVPTIYDALLQALARSLLHFETSYGSAWNRPVGDNVGWLDFTHGVTFANAARNICRKHPRLWRPALLQMACFLGRNRSYLDVELDEAPWFVDDAGAFFTELEERLVDHGLPLPIYSAHLLKTTLAVQEELPHAGESTRRYLLAGLNRFLNSPLKQKHARRLARQAIALVRRDFT